MRRALAIARISARSLRRYPQRSGLAILSGLLGVAGALSSVNYALGGREKVVNRLERLGTNILNITPQQSKSVAGRARTGAIVTTLSESDYIAVGREVPLFVRSSALSTRSFTVKAGDLSKTNSTVVGIEPDYMRIRNWPIQSGKLFDNADARRLARVAMLGSTVARAFFGTNDPVGQRIFINRVPFQVVAVMQERGQSLDAANEDDQIYVPLRTAMRRLANVDYLSGIVFEVRRWEDMDEAAGNVEQVLRNRHVHLGKQFEDFQVQNQKELIDTQMAASSQLLFFVRWIEVSALAVSGLGVLATAWISVKERTREIGTRRALGAVRQDIFLQILLEAAALGLLGCIGGLATAAACSRLLAQWADQPALFDWPSAWTAAGWALMLNLVFAIIPAWAAAELDPIQALRFE